MFIVGIIVGVIAAWWFFERRDASSRATLEEGWKKKLAHVEQEVRRADAAHDETKERLRLCQQEKVALEATPPAAAAPAPLVTEKAPPPAPAVPAEVERLAQARRRVDAKLAQLPAGSSARKRLMAERAALDGGEAKAAPAPNPVQLFTPPADAPDDLEKIRGIGPVLRQKLNDLGITTFSQIAALTPADIERIDEMLDFKGRIEREDWIGQARALGGQG
jgi:predicted flap endonuclease-1-like 5' DNA nuclease